MTLLMFLLAILNTRTLLKGTCVSKVKIADSIWLSDNIREFISPPQKREKNYKCKKFTETPFVTKKLEAVHHKEMADLIMVRQCNGLLCCHSKLHLRKMGKRAILSKQDLHMKMN